MKNVWSSKEPKYIIFGNNKKKLKFSPRGTQEVKFFFSLGLLMSARYFIQLTMVTNECICHVQDTVGFNHFDECCSNSTSGFQMLLLSQGTVMFCPNPWHQMCFPLWIIADVAKAGCLVVAVFACSWRDKLPLDQSKQSVCRPSLKETWSREWWKIPGLVCWSSKLNEFV